MTIADFLRARLDEDEQTAREAATTAAAAIGEHVHKIGAADGRPYDGAWWTNDYDHVFALDPRSGRKLLGMVADCGYGTLGLTTHIASHAPARVLREVEAKRRLLDLHARHAWIDGCAVCDFADESCGCVSGPSTAYPCTTLRLIALPYADHPDYREGWKR